MVTIVPPLTEEEREHYRWLVDGLLIGIRNIAASELSASERASSLVEAAETVRDLLDEILARCP